MQDICCVNHKTKAYQRTKHRRQIKMLQMVSEVLLGLMTALWMFTASLENGRLFCLKHHITSQGFFVTAGPRTAPREEWWNKNCPDNMREISNVQQFVDELADTGDNLVIVDFFAKWCHACRALFPKLCQICRDNPDMRLLKVDWDENKDIAKPLGVRVLPYFQLYRGAEGKVAEFSCSVAKIQRMRDAINANQAARCSLGLNPTLKETFPDNKPSHEMERHEITILDSTGDSVLSQSIASFDEETEPQANSQAPASQPDRPVASSVVNKY